MRKPADLFDRDREWRDLTRFAGGGSALSLGIVYGRRRQGKSFLLRRLAGATGGLYHQALEEQPAQALARLGDVVAAERGLEKGQVRFSDLGEALRTILAGPRRTKTPRLVVLDEIPFLLARSPELPSLLQSLLDLGRDAGRPLARLVLCGSALGVMSQLLSGARALRGRASLEMVLSPFDFREARAFWRVKDPRLALSLHALVGGTPGYLDLVGAPPASERDLAAWLSRTLLDPSHALFREAEYILSEDPRMTERSLYHSVLDAISRGERTPARIAGRVGRPEGALRHPLRLLEEAGFVLRRDDALRERRPTLTVADPIVRFHHVVMRPELAALEERRARDVWQRAQASFRSQILGPHFEDVARSWVRRYASAETLGGDVGRVGSAVIADRDARATLEVDVVALSARGGSGPRPRVLLLGEAKGSASAPGTRDLDRLEHARRIVEESGRASVERAKLALFSLGGFDPALVAAARRRDDVVLVDLERLYGGA